MDGKNAYTDYQYGYSNGVCNRHKRTMVIVVETFLAITTELGVTLVSITVSPMGAATAKNMEKANLIAEETEKAKETRWSPQW